MVSYGTATDVDGIVCDFHQWIFITAAAISLIVVGYMIFLRLEPGFAEEM
jgi:hypothetical protein